MGEKRKRYRSSPLSTTKVSPRRSRASARAATATASYIVAHGAAAAQAGVVHGFAVAFGVGACFLALGAIVSAVLISAGPAEVSGPEGAVAGAGG